MPRYFQHKQVLRGVYARSTGAGVIILVGGIGETVIDEMSQARQPGTRQLSGCRYGVGIYGRRAGKEIRHSEARRGREENNRDKRRLEAELVDRSHVFTNVEDAVPAANGRVVMSENIPRKPNARANPSGDAVLEG